MTDIYITILPVIIAGVLNMVFTKTKIYKKYAKPIDFGKKFIDGHRVLGDNKTYIGFISMVIFAAFAQAFWGYVCGALGFENRNELYNLYNNTLIYNLLTGFLVGFLYMVCELPNSFIKRRLNIQPGKTNKGFVGALFFVVDQFDSVLGIGVAFYFLCGITFGRTILYILTGGLVHLAVNSVLLNLKIRNNL